MTTAILQVLGDPKGYKTANFIIDGKIYRTNLSALAIYEWLNRDAKIVLLVPDSLITKIEDNVDNAIGLLKDRERFKTRILELLGVEADVLMIPSVGEYSSARFEGSVENTITFIFKELVKLNFDEIYADISTGQNIYATSMLEALRKYVTYRKLRCILQGGEGVSVKVAYVPPVLTEGQKVKVELHDFDVKAFFDLPKPNSKEICKDIKKKIEIRKKYRRFFNEISNDLNVLKIAFNAIKFNAPLVFYHPEILNLDPPVLPLYIQRYAMSFLWHRIKNYLRSHYGFTPPHIYADEPQKCLSLHRHSIIFGIPRIMDKREFTIWLDQALINFLSRMGHHIQKTVNNRLTEDQVKALDKLGKKLLKRYHRYRRKHPKYQGPINYICKLVKRGKIWEWENPPPDYLKYLEERQKQRNLAYDGASVSPPDYVKKYLVKNLEEILEYEEQSNAPVVGKKKPPDPKLAWYWLMRARFHSVSPEFRMKVEKRSSDDLRFVGSFRRDDLEDFGIYENVLPNHNV